MSEENIGLKTEKINWNPENTDKMGIKKYIDMMSGSIAVQSMPNVGTRFVIDIPIAVDVSPADEKADETPNETKKENKKDANTVMEQYLEGDRILLAEYDELDAEIMAEIFKDSGADVVIASNGEVALELYSQSEESYFDIIIMDVMMPKMDGITASREIRHLNRPDAATVPIITMTANAFDEYRKSALEAGVSAYLTKPIDVNALMSVLKSVL
jgi:CheY-like chemotaxis protein